MAQPSVTAAKLIRLSQKIAILPKLAGNWNLYYLPFTVLQVNFWIGFLYFLLEMLRELHFRSDLHLLFALSV
jgi:hypothetical protein